MAGKTPKTGKKAAPKRKAAKKKATTRPGAPAFKPTEADRQRVMEMAAAGFTREQMCRMIRWQDGTKKAGQPISIDSLERHFPAELETGDLDCALDIASNQARIARSRDPDLSGAAVRAGQYWLKTRGRHVMPDAGWQENVNVDLNTGADIERIDSELADIVARMDNAGTESVS